MKIRLDETQWVLFDTERLIMLSIKMSAIDLGFLLSRDTYQDCLVFTYFYGYLRLVSRGVTSPAGDPYGIDVGNNYVYYDIFDELYSVLEEFTKDNKEFIAEYHAISLL